MNVKKCFFFIADLLLLDIASSILHSRPKRISNSAMMGRIAWLGTNNQRVFNVLQNVSTIDAAPTIDVTNWRVTGTHCTIQLAALLWHFIAFALHAAQAFFLWTLLKLSMKRFGYGFSLMYAAKSEILYFHCCDHSWQHVPSNCCTLFFACSVFRGGFLLVETLTGTVWLCVYFHVRG